MAKKQTAPTVTTSETKKSKKPVAEQPQAPVAVVAKPVKEKMPVEKQSAKREIYPITTPLQELPFVPKWVRSSVPKKVNAPKDGTFAFISVYRLVRELASAQGKDYRKLPVSELVTLLVAYAIVNPDTVVGAWMRKSTPNQMRDLRARLQWCMVAVLAIDDTQGVTQGKRE